MEQAVAWITAMGGHPSSMIMIDNHNRLSNIFSSEKGKIFLLGRGWYFGLCSVFFFLRLSSAVVSPTYRTYSHHGFMVLNIYTHDVRRRGDTVQLYHRFVGLYLFTVTKGGTNTAPKSVREKWGQFRWNMKIIMAARRGWEFLTHSWALSAQ